MRNCSDWILTVIVKISRSLLKNQRPFLLWIFFLLRPQKRSQPIRIENRSFCKFAGTRHVLKGKHSRKNKILDKIWTNFTKEQTLWQGATGGLVVYTGWDRVGKKGMRGWGSSRPCSLWKTCGTFCYCCWFKGMFLRNSVQQALMNVLIHLVGLPEALPNHQWCPKSSL